MESLTAVDALAFLRQHFGQRLDYDYDTGKRAMMHGLNAHFRVSLHDARAIIDALEQANDLRFVQEETYEQATGEDTPPDEPYRVTNPPGLPSGEGNDPEDIDLEPLGVLQGLVSGQILETHAESVQAQAMEADFAGGYWDIGHPV